MSRVGISGGVDSVDLLLWWVFFLVWSGECTETLELSEVSHTATTLEKAR